MSELAFYHMLVLGTTITISEGINLLLLLFFVVSLHLVLNMMNLYETKLKESQVRKENENMLMHLSNLYVESVHLKRRYKMRS